MAPNLKKYEDEKTPLLCIPQRQNDEYSSNELKDKQPKIQP